MAGSGRCLTFGWVSTRTLTVVFTDLVDSTALLVDHDLRQGDELLTAHLAAIDHQVVRHGGTVVKSLGDGVMVTFDCARRALECAVAAQQVLTGQSQLVRIGVSTGDVQIHGGDCVGLPVVEASRLCAHAAGGQVLIAESARLAARDYGPVAAVGAVHLKGLPQTTEVWEATWTPTATPPLQVVLADDAALVRQGIAQLLECAGINVIGQASDAEQLLDLVAELRPDVAIVDVRMPPTYTVEGLDAAERIRRGHPSTGVLVLTQELHPRYAARLRAASPTGVGYLLKELVDDVQSLADAVRTVAAGGTAFDPRLQTAAHPALDHQSLVGQRPRP